MLNEVNPLELPAEERDRVGAGCSRAVRLVVFLLLMCGLIATGMLSYQRLFKVQLPGCGAESACERAAASEYALIFQIPVAYLGFAFLGAMSLAWLDHGRRGVPGPLLWAARGGALVSLVFVVLIAEHGLYCGYCLAAHACNLAVWGITESAARSSLWLRPSLVFAGGFLTVLLLFHIVKTHEVDSYHARRDKTTRKIIDDIVRSEASRLKADHGGNPSAWLPVPASGGHRLGADDARIRITVFFDYQCPYCQSLDRVLEILRERGDIAITWRHLPASTACNCHAGADSHPRACQDARLAIAAAAIGGGEGFLRLHHWLLERGGRFSDDELEQALPALHIDDAGAFWALAHAPQTRDAVQADVELAHQIGADRTPAVFVNGVRLDSWDPAGAVIQAVQALAEVSAE